MSVKRDHRTWLLLAGLVLGGIACWFHYRPTPRLLPVPYDRVVNAYFQHVSAGMPSTYDVDVWALWRELGVRPDSLRGHGSLNLWNIWRRLRGQQVEIFSPGWYLFNAHAGDRIGLECEFASLARTKVIAMTQDCSCTHILVFRPTEGKDGTSFRFSYHFTTGIGGHSDRSHVRLLEPEPGLELLEITYRNIHGTGAHGSGWSLYRLDCASAACLLQTYNDGWFIDEGPWGFGYRCDITDLARTWPKIGMTYFAEYAPGDDLVGNRRDDDFVDLYELRTQVELTWDGKRRAFRPSASNVLTHKEIQVLMSNLMKFLEQKAQDQVFLARPNSPIVKKQVRRSECLSGWGL